MKKGATRKLILNTKTIEVFEGLKNLCEKENLHIANLSNKLSGKINNNTDYLYIKKIYPEINNPYFTKDNRAFNFIEVFNYFDKFGGGDIAIVEMVDNNKKYILKDEKVGNYIEIKDFF